MRRRRLLAVATDLLSRTSLSLRRDQAPSRVNADMEILTPRLLLREFEERDAVDTNVYERDPEVVRYQSHGPRTLEESLEYIRLSMGTARASPRRTFDMAVVLRAEGRLIGRCGIHVAQPEIREGALWYILNPVYWSRGYTTERPERSSRMASRSSGSAGCSSTASRPTSPRRAWERSWACAARRTSWRTPGSRAHGPIRSSTRSWIGSGRPRAGSSLCLRGTSSRRPAPRRALPSASSSVGALYPPEVHQRSSAP